MRPAYILADDLSGALEAGAAFRSRGWDVVLPLVEDPVGAGVGSALAVVSTETRTLAPAAAESIVRRVLDRRRARGEQLLFKKIDSTLRGPIGAELRAVVDVLAPPLILFCPANPAAGRSVRDGVLHVGALPLEQTEFRHDPAWPATTGNILARLAEQGVAVSGHLGLAELRRGTAVAVEAIRGARGPRNAPRVVVSDAVTEEDLRALLAAGCAAEPGTVFVGSGAFGAIVAATLPPPQPAASSPHAGVSSILILCGSRHPASHRQVDELQRAGRAFVLLAGPEQDAAAVAIELQRALALGGAAAVRADPTLTRANDAVTTWLAQLAALVCRGAQPEALVLTGGETAHAVCRALDGVALDIEGEAEPGAVIARLRRARGRTLLVVTKPGGYGSPHTFLKVLDCVMN